VVGELVLAGWIVDALQRLLHLGDLEGHGSSPVVGRGGADLEPVVGATAPRATPGSATSKPAG
jgi:hypothetical protein